MLIIEMKSGPVPVAVMYGSMPSKAIVFRLVYIALKAFLR